MAHSYSPSRMYPNAGPGWRCAASTSPGASVTSSIVALAFFPSSFSMMSFWESVFTPPLPCSPCWARGIPPTARVPKTIANRVHLMTRPPIETKVFSSLGNKDVWLGSFPVRAARRRTGHAVQLRRGLHEVRRVQPLHEPAVDLRQYRTGFSLLALLLVQTTQAHDRP